MKGPYFWRDHCYREVETRGSAVPPDWENYHNPETCLSCNPKVTQETLKAIYLKDFGTTHNYGLTCDNGRSTQNNQNRWNCFLQQEQKGQKTPPLWRLKHDIILCEACNPPGNPPRRQPPTKEIEQLLYDALDVVREMKNY